MKKAIRKLLSLILAVVAVVTGILYAQRMLQQRSGADVYAQAEALAMTPATPSATEAEESIPEGPRWVPAAVTDDPNLQELAEKNLASLRRENEDVAGWIWIPDTPVNYPVMQGQDNDFYLNHTWLGEENSMGSIFLEHQNAKDFSEFHTIVYGHSMTNGEMFGSLQKYRYPEYRKEHPYLYLLTDAGVWRYEIFAAYETQTGTDPYKFGMQWDKTKHEYIDTVKLLSVIGETATPAITDRILTLSTCAGFGYESRWVVQAYLPMELMQ